MTHTFEELKGKTVAQLREIAEGVDHEAVHGFSTMHKHQLLHALCIAFNLEEHVHHEVVGIDKRAIKKQIHELKAQRDAALEAHDRETLKRVRRQMHHLKRRIRAATV
jgi:hypothetical protein